MKFLIPTDFSENAFHAAIYALTLAKEKPRSSIHLLHMITPVLNDPGLIPEIEKEATISLEKLLKNSTPDAILVALLIPSGSEKLQQKLTIRRKI